MKRTVYTVEDETTGETVAADTNLSELEDAGSLIVEFDIMRAETEKKQGKEDNPSHTFIIEVHTLH